MSEDIDITPSSGNVFADLGLPDPDVLLAKAELAITISSIIRQRGLTQTAAARELGVHQSRVSAITRGRLDDFSLERLLSFARCLGQDVSIILSPSLEATGQGRMVAQQRDEAMATIFRELFGDPEPTVNPQPQSLREGEQWPRDHRSSEGPTRAR